MANPLTRKVGPLPLWAWAAITGATIGAIILLRRGSSSTSSAAPADLGQNAGLIDPTTGQPYASEFGGGGTAAGGSAPTLAQEISDVTGLAAAFQQAGLFQGGGSGGGLIQLAPGATYYDPTTGQTVHGDVASSVAPPGKTAAKTKSPLDKARAAVATGKISRANRQRLNKAGYTNAQINYHLNRKTPLGVPAREKSKRQKERHLSHSPVGAHAAPTHPNQHKTAAPPHHAPAPAPKTRRR